MNIIRLVSVNVDGIELDRTFIIKELKNDFLNECMYVPANDDEIKLVEIDGINVTNAIEKTAYDDTLVFIDVVKYLKWE